MYRTASLSDGSGKKKLCVIFNNYIWLLTIIRVYFIFIFFTPNQMERIVKYSELVVDHFHI